MADHYRNLRPRLPRHYVVNPRLDSWVEGVMKATLTVFSGPAGYGKTSAIISIAEQLDTLEVRVAWLRVEASDNVPEAMFTSMFQALSGLVERKGIKAGAPGQANQDMLLQLIQNISKPFVLVLDDLEFLNDETCLGALARLISLSPENAHFVVASRTLQGFPLSRLKIEGRLQLVQTDALAFDNSQVDLLLNNCYDLGLDQSMVAAVAGKIESWPAGLQMTAIFLESGRPVDAILDGHAGSVSDIYAYLWEEVFLNLEQETQQFLMETSFLDRLNGDLCDRVTGRNDSSEFLERAYNANLFLTLMDERQGTFRYHNLFAEFLRNKLLQSRSRQEIRTMHESAAAWHAARSDYETALQRLFEVDAWDMACSVLKACAWEVMGRGRIRMLLSWFETLPESELHKHPAIQVAFGWTLILSNKLSECNRLVQHLKATGETPEISEFAVLEPMVLIFEDRFEECHKVLPAAYTNTSAGAHLALGTLHNIQTLLLLNRRDYPSIEPLVAKSRTEFLKAGAGYGENYAAWFQIASLLSQGYLRRAHRMAEENWSRTMETSLRFSSASALAGICLAQTLFHLGQLTQARQLVIEHFDILCETAMIDNVVEAIRIVNRVHCLEGNLDQAETWLSECSTKTRARRSERLSRTMMVESGYLGIRAFDLGRTERVPKLLSNQTGTRKSLFLPISEDVETDWMHNLRVLIRSGPQEKNLSMIKRQIQFARGKRQGNLLLKLNVLHAQALVLSDQKMRALKVLEECARQAATEGFISHFHEEGPVVGELIDSFCETMRPTQYLKRDHDLIRFFKETVTDETKNPWHAADSVAMRDLTKREIQVFELLGFGLTNAAIAARMNVSINTVKFHLKNIYAKLGIEGRARAVSKSASSRSGSGVSDTSEPR